MRSRVSFVVVVAMVVGWMAGCASRADLRVSMHGGVPSAQLWRGGGLLGTSTEAEPLSQCSVYSAAGAQARLLWQVRATRRDTVVRSIRYGAVPLGFEQVIPPSGPAPDLTPDQKYLFSCTGNGTGAAEFRAPDTVTRTAPPLRRRSR